MTAGARGAGTLRLPAKTAARRRLFCLPYAGGGGGAYSRWRSVLADDIELVAMLLPGRESRFREAPFQSIREIVDATLSVIQASGDLPYALFGHSMGGIVAYELALALESGAGPAPERLFVSSRRAPDDAEMAPPAYGLPDARFLDELQSRYGAIPRQILDEPELLALLLPTLRADIRAIEEYQATPGKVRCPVIVYGGTQDRHPRPDQLPGWQRAAERKLRVRLFEGDHFYIASRRDELVADLCASWPPTSPRDDAREEAGE